MPDIFDYSGVAQMKKHTPEVKAFLKGRWITRKQFDKLGTDQLTKIGTWNKSKKHHPKTAVKGYDMILKEKKRKKGKKNKMNLKTI
jgi:hypothetical protein